MRKVHNDSLIGGEVLGKEISTENGLIIIPAGSVLKKVSIEKIRELQIQYIYIEDKELKRVDKAVEQKIQEECVEQVKKTIERYSYCAKNELQEIMIVADHIMKEILADPNIMYNMSCVRNQDEGTYSHVISVSALVVLVALRMKISKKRVKEAAIGALLHDIGMVYLPFNYSKLNLEACDEKQRKEVKKHVITGYCMLEKESWLSNIAKEIILSHHERDDGSGYPMHLTSDKISLETKIVAVCDEFDNRVYGSMRKKEKVYRVIEYMMSEAGVQFDFQVIQTFIEAVAVYPIGTYVLTNKGDVGVVIGQNSKAPTRPLIQLTVNLKGSIKTEKPVIDLTKELTVFISDTIEA